MRGIERQRRHCSNGRISKLHRRHSWALVPAIRVFPSRLAMGGLKTPLFGVGYDPVDALSKILAIGSSENHKGRPTQQQRYHRLLRKAFWPKTP
jgi:hypothetical protein